jgi:hypothetical protein
VLTLLVIPAIYSLWKERSVAADADQPEPVTSTLDARQIGASETHAG